MPEGAMVSFLQNIGAFFTWSVERVSNLVWTISDNPVLTVLVLAMPICGFAIGMLKRLIG